MAALASITDLEERTGDTYEGADLTRALWLLDSASAVIRAITGQYLSEATTTLDRIAPVGQWLVLPERPVTAITSVVLDGETLTAGEDYKRFGSRLWREDYWAEYGCDDPVSVQVTYTHGLALDDEALRLAKDEVLNLVQRYLDSDPGVASEQIDDYTVRFTEGDMPAEARSLLRATYKRRPVAGSVAT